MQNLFFLFLLRHIITKTPFVLSPPISNFIRISRNPSNLLFPGGLPFGCLVIGFLTFS